MPELGHARGIPRPAATSTPRCSRCGRTTGRCCWPSTGSSRARATRPARSCSRRRRPPPARRWTTRPVEQLPHVAAWREAYRAFGAKPQRTRNSLEALLRRAAVRAAAGEPAHRPLQRGLGAAPDPARRGGPHPIQRCARLVRATGAEPFDTVADGAAVIEHPEPGEVVWCDDAGVTCRRWNWRQARRTQLGDDTTTALFILDALDPITDEALHTAADDLSPT